MRRVLLGDMTAVARVLRRLPVEARGRVAALLILQAEAADRHLREAGTAHPRWGTGSLMSAAASWPRVPEPDFDDPEYVSCWILALQALLQHRAEAFKEDGAASRVHGLG